jgi:DNA-binding beta-propeller fold protein YncE
MTHQPVVAWALASRMQKNFLKPSISQFYHTELDRIRGISVRDGRLVAVGYMNGSCHIHVLDVQSGAFMKGNSMDSCSPFGVGLSAEGEAFVSDSSNGYPEVFDKELKHVRVFGETFFQMGGVASTSNGEWFVVDTLNNKIKLFTSDGVSVGVFGSDDIFHHPCCVAVDGGGSIYITDSQNCRVQVFDKQMQFVMMFGRRGRGIGDFRCPMHIAVTLEGNRIFVSDLLKGNVQEFDKFGEYVRTIGWFGRQAPLAVDKDGSLFIATSHGCVHKYSPE